MINFPPRIFFFTLHFLTCNELCELITPPIDPLLYVLLCVLEIEYV